MYKENVNIRFSETDESGKLSLSGLLRLFQDCVYSHAYTVGQTPNKLSKAAWYLLSRHIESYAMPECNEKVTVSTWIYKQKASVAYKQIIMTASDGKLPALEDSMWCYVDILSGKPALFPKDGWKCDDYGDRIMTKYPLKRIKSICTDNTEALSLSKTIVDEQFLDINHHANNVLLTEYAMKLSGYSNCCSYLSAEFLKQVKAGAELYPYLSEEEMGKTVALCDSEQSPFAVFYFERSAKPICDTVKINISATNYN